MSWLSIAIGLFHGAAMQPKGWSVPGLRYQKTADCTLIALQEFNQKTP
jgi:hypothetical protein